MTTKPTHKPVPTLEDLQPRLDGRTVVDDAGALTDFGLEVLDFERHWWRYAGAKETEIRERWDISSTRYYQLLNHLIDQPAALIEDALLVRRLRRLRTTRRRQRSAQRLLEDGADR